MLRLLWVALALVMGFTVSGSIALSAWLAVVGLSIVCLVAPSTWGLTVLRMVAPALVPAAVLAWVQSDSAARGGASLALAALTALVTASGEVGEAMVQGNAYGSEHRFPLRPPAAMLVPMALSWLVWCALSLTAVTLLVQHQWIGGVPLAAVAVAATWFLGRRFHRFAGRWLVLLPGSVVVHDGVVLGETLMVQRTNVAGARLALADTDAADLTGPAGGHALEVAVREMVLAVFAATPNEPKGRAIHLQSFLVAPTRPGRALTAMADAKLPMS
jgi:hypothetical protein